jgi:hypothetical protein
VELKKSFIFTAEKHVQSRKMANGRHIEFTFLKINYSKNARSVLQEEKIVAR